MGLSGIPIGYPEMQQRPMIINVTSNGKPTPHQHVIPQQPLINHQHSIQQHKHSTQPPMNNITMTHQLSDTYPYKTTNLLHYMITRSQNPDINKK